MKKKQKLTRLVLCALFAALIVVLTFTPLGYIIIGPGIAITTIHLVTILGASILGIKEGAFLGAFWGILCVIKAFQEPIPGNIPFQNPMISLVPRIIVGLVAGVVFYALLKTKLKKPISLGIAAGVVGVAIGWGMISDTVKKCKKDFFAKTPCCLQGIPDHHTLFERLEEAARLVTALRSAFYV